MKLEIKRIYERKVQSDKNLILSIIYYYDAFIQNMNESEIVDMIKRVLLNKKLKQLKIIKKEEPPIYID